MSINKITYSLPYTPYVLNIEDAGCIYLPVTYCSGNWEFPEKRKTEMDFQEIHFQETEEKQKKMFFFLQPKFQESSLWVFNGSYVWLLGQWLSILTWQFDIIRLLFSIREMINVL